MITKHQVKALKAQLLPDSFFSKYDIIPIDHSYSASPLLCLQIMLYPQTWGATNNLHYSTRWPMRRQYPHPLLNHKWGRFFFNLFTDLALMRIILRQEGSTVWLSRDVWMGRRVEGEIGFMSLVPPLLSWQPHLPPLYWRIHPCTVLKVFKPPIGHPPNTLPPLYHHSAPPILYTQCIPTLESNPTPQRACKTQQCIHPSTPIKGCLQQFSVQILQD